MVLPNYHFGCHSNQSNSAFWTKCVYSVEDYSSNISIKLLSTYLQWVRNKGLLSFFSSQVGHLISLLLIYIICSGLLLHFCFVISGLCLGITTPKWHSLSHLQAVRGRWVGGCGWGIVPLARQIISKSCSFSPETEFTLLILASKSEFSSDSPLLPHPPPTLLKPFNAHTLFQTSAYGPGLAPV